MMNFILEKKFSSGHFYENKKWTEEENQKKFGKCYSKHGHGHNYKLVIYLKFKAWDEAQIQKIQTQIDTLIEEVDHKHLNFEIPEFKNINPTTENIALYFKAKLQKLFPSQVILLKLFESEDLGTVL